MNTVRITSGKYKGRQIATPGGDTHPMGERERIALFNIIGKKIKGAKVLDAYSGSGALGIEAISRGANEVVFVDRSHVAMQTTNQNCMMLEIPVMQVAFYRGAVNAFYKKFVQGAGIAIDPMMGLALETFPKEVDIIIADPPYDDVNTKEISRITKAYLKPDGILVLSHPGEAPEMPGLDLISTHEYTTAHLSVYALA